ncbi:serine/threonine-protein kinase Sgk1-like [Hippocampus zosterae]|uniref:serine/threonine-protein kinase Sgk1-like n=1 Tax=Hippocampus zosterae TaxID=109293 RepID=UPI00223DE89E|nr:serine/threonine-protein kinase Sgk1-like [Hippocampus zosterae]
MSKRVGVDDFVMISVIGKGAYAKVVLAKHKATKQVCALKIIKKKKLLKGTKENLALLEKDILTRVKHPFMLRLLYCFQTEEKLFFVLEFCPGGELFNLISRLQTLSEEHAKFYAAQMLLALHHMHTHQVVYRDLKPENVLIAHDGYVKIADFGLCKRNFLTEEVFSVSGTPEYLAPENLERRPCSEAIDWWALGSIIYEMLVGEPPFMAPNREEIFSKIKKEEVRLPPTLSLECQDLLRRLLAKKPGARLGAKGVEEITGHPWFSKINWDKLLAKEYRAPYVPHLKSELDLSHFDDEFLKTNV